VEVVRELVQAGGDELLLKTLADGTSCLCIASMEGHVEVARELMAGEAGQRLLELADTEGRSSLAAACGEGHVAVAMELVKAGGHALLHRVDGRGATCLFGAFAHVEMVRALVQVGGDALVQRTLPSGCTALHIACQEGRHDVVEALAAAGGQQLLAMATTGGRYTCLHYAADSGHLKVVEALCRAAPAAALGGLIGSRSAEGYTAADLARRAGHHAVCELLARLAG
jgi:ankyrin repeat protein